MEALCLTIPDTQKALGNIGRTTVYDLINQGRLETVKIGRRTLIKTSSIRAIVGEPKPEPPPAGQKA